MSQQTTGRAALVLSNLPASKTVTGATNATPIVVTTSTNHGLQTNEIVQITGVTGNTAANGIFIAVVQSGTTFALTAYPGGTNVAGTGAYAAGGTVQSMGYGVTVPVPVDLSDAMRAGTVNVPHEAELDRLAWLAFGATRATNGVRVGTQGLATFSHQPWLVAGVAATGSGAQSTIPLDGTGSMYLDAPHGTVLYSIVIRLFPAVHAALPGTMPSYTLYKINGTTGVTATSWSVTDPSGSTVAYNAAHNVTLSIPEHEQIDHVSYVYVLVFTGEAGANKADLPIGQPVLSLF